MKPLLAKLNTSSLLLKKKKKNFYQCEKKNINYFRPNPTFFHSSVKSVIWLYYEFSLLHIFSLVLQPWMSAYIRKTDGVYISVPKNDWNMDDKIFIFRISRCPFPYHWRHSSMTSKYVLHHISCIGCLMKENNVLNF